MVMVIMMTIYADKDSEENSVCMAMNPKSRSGVKPKLFVGLILVYGGHRLITIHTM